MQLPKSKETKETYWFPTPQESGDEAQHILIQKRILQELIALQKLEQFNPQDNQESRKQFWSYFNWTNSTLNKAAQKTIQRNYL